MIFTQNEKMRLDRFLSANLNASRSQIAQLIAKNAVKINDKVANKSGILLKMGDKIEVDLVDSRESSGNSQDLCESLPEIARIYEDNDFLVLNKPPFLATHGAPSLKEKSLVDWLKAQKIELSTISGETREGIIHRLDKQTSGAIVAAKNNRAHRLLSEQLADKSMGRIYLAIIDLPLKYDIEVECYLARNPKNRLKISKVAVRDFDAIRGADSPKIPRGARYAKSKFFKLITSKDGKKELICAKLFTGRTHQIRAHLESINRHIVGDELYGYKGKSPELRVMLHSYLLYLSHPKEMCESHESRPISSLRGSLSEAKTTKQSTLNRHTERSEVSKTRESNKNGESMIEKEIDELDSTLQHCDSNNLTPCDLDSLLHTSCFAQNDKKPPKNPKMLFLAPLFDDMQSFLEQHFNMGEVNEILRTLPNRFGF